MEAIADDAFYTSGGPFATVQTDYAGVLPSNLTETKVTVHITKPVLITPGSAPFVIIFNGFKCPSRFYRLYAERLASWGYVVLQYDYSFIKTLDEKIEVGFVPFFMEWITEEGRAECVDVQRTAVAGHSRGGKLAGLALAEYVEHGVKTAFLLDPDDMTTFQTESEANPSAVKALKKCSAPFAVVGAGVGGMCNPPEANYTHFWEVAKNSSWLVTIPQAGHMQLTGPNWAEAWVLDLVCGSGKISHEAAMTDSVVPMLAWLDRFFREVERRPQASLFEDWRKSEVSAGRITFEQMEEPTPALQANVANFNLGQNS